MTTASTNWSRRGPSWVPSHVPGNIHLFDIPAALAAITKAVIACIGDDWHVETGKRSAKFSKSSASVTVKVTTATETLTPKYSIEAFVDGHSADYTFSSLGAQPSAIAEYISETALPKARNYYKAEQARQLRQKQQRQERRQALRRGEVPMKAVRRWERDGIGHEWQAVTVNVPDWGAWKKSK